jgi:lambda family phage minor tail protein L
MNLEGLNSNQIYNYIVSGSASINSEISSLQPSTQIIFYEIDLSEIAPKLASFSYSEGNPINNAILRIYNDYNLFNISNNPNGKIKWQNNFYYPFPIKAEGFEYNTNGTLPTPKLTIANFSPDKSFNSFYKYLRMNIESLGDIIGSKFTRTKTFLKYLDGSNFSNGINPFNPQTGLYEIELPKDIYYIDRKSYEDKTRIEYQLSSILDLENLYLPGRSIIAKKCPFQYRGEGCVYEYNSRLTDLHSGVYAKTTNPLYQVFGLQTAPPVATENDQLFISNNGGLFSSNNPAGNTAIFRLTGSAGNSGLWIENANYVSGDFIFLEKEKLKYYFVCIQNNTSTIFNAPPNTNFWAADNCAKSIKSCRLRWLKNPAFRPVIWPTSRRGQTHTEMDLQIFAQNYTNGWIAQNNAGIYPSGRGRQSFTDEVLGEVIYTIQEVENQFVTGLNGIPINFPRRPGCENPAAEYAHGIPKDKDGNYLNGFLPYGGFPAVNRPEG